MTGEHTKLEHRRPVRNTIEVFSNNLLKSEQMMEYVLSRGITEEQVQKGMVGFCPPYYRHWFPLLRGRITTTINDAHGRPVALAGRQYEPMRAATYRSFQDTHGHNSKAQTLIDKWDGAKWINEPYPKSKHLFHLDVAKTFAREIGYLVVVEGYFDALTLPNYDLPNTSALCGTRLTAYHAALITRYTDTIVVLMDGDAAGENALLHIAPRCEEVGLQYKVLSLPNKYDPDEFVLKYGGVLRRACDQLVNSDNTRMDLTL
jgi:DNA primase